MIVLRGKEKLALYQVLLTLEKRQKNPPFVAILMRAEKGGGEITPGQVQADLLPALPLTACQNLLSRLEDLGYLDSQGARTNGSSKSETIFYLTDKGKAAAQTQTFWQAEKGLYDLYLSESTLVQDLTGQPLIKISPHYGPPSKGNPEEVPDVLHDYWNKEVRIMDKEGHEEVVRIVHFEAKCIPMEPVEVTLEIEVVEEEGTIRFMEVSSQKSMPQPKETPSPEAKSNGLLAKFHTPLSEEAVREELLKSKFGASYDEVKKVIRMPFDPNNLAWVRDVELEKPTWRGVSFEPVRLEKVSFLPANEQEARMWVEEWLFRNIARYFWDEEEFRTYVEETLRPILDHYPELKNLGRKELVEKFSKRENAFYAIAKLETTTYLTY
jgi:hypothetical protein